MAVNIGRRDFVRGVAGAAGSVFLGAGGSWAMAAPGSRAEEWCFPLLGDLHIDHLDHHDFEWRVRPGRHASLRPGAGAVHGRAGRSRDSQGHLHPRAGRRPTKELDLTGVLDGDA